MNYYTLLPARDLLPVTSQPAVDKLRFGCHWRSLVIDSHLIEVGISKSTRDLIAVRCRDDLLSMGDRKTKKHQEILRRV